MATNVRYGAIGTGTVGIEHIEDINAITGAHLTPIAVRRVGSPHIERSTRDDGSR